MALFRISLHANGFQSIIGSGLGSFKVSRSIVVSSRAFLLGKGQGSVSKRVLKCLGESIGSGRLVTSCIKRFPESGYFQTISIRMLSSGSNPSPSHSSKKDKEDVASSKTSETEEVGEETPAPKELSKKDKLKQAVRDYGATVIVFHVTMSLMSLGFFYLLVSSGLDVVAILGKIGLAGAVSAVAETASTFVVAYAIHKIFAPLRITITLGVTPLIVRKLRSMGILKQVKSKSS